ncbi:hypothetical protein Pla52o_04870 [Novipirellula galeiformis]|uniref:Transmembrane protein n=1 Tax=Novipirellula galeiformis TaxID=2528004 RepID=A0A5C6CST1_9BACT|nr:hypothetical protein [Novipirellula galeiformis]TWU26634.1 hypothetical protein Pla52o_04870 [Novipirellula galeiformis]
MNLPPAIKKKSSADELRALVAGLQPRSPQEVMGQAASSSLIASTIMATLIGGLLIVVMTATVFLFASEPSPKKPTTEVAKTMTEQASVAPSKEPQASVTTAAQDPAVPKPATEAAVDAMGISETKDPNSSTEPLQSRLDKLLDGLE